MAVHATGGQECDAHTNAVTADTVPPSPRALDTGCGPARLRPVTDACGHVVEVRRRAPGVQAQVPGVGPEQEVRLP